MSTNNDISAVTCFWNAINFLEYKQTKEDNNCLCSDRCFIDIEVITQA